MASRQQADQEPLEGVILADHDLLHFVAGGLEKGGVPPERGRRESLLAAHLVSSPPPKPERDAGRPSLRTPTGVERTS